MDRTTNSAPGARRQGRRLSGRRSSEASEDPTRMFFRRHLKDYEAFENHVYAARACESPRHYAAAEYRGDTPDEAFNPVNIRMRRG
jgi:hypothetical protein